MKNIQHKIRGSQPGFIGIELPDNYSVLLLDEDNFNSYRKEGRYYGQNIEVKDSYAHFQKPVDGSWHLVCYDLYVRSSECLVCDLLIFCYFGQKM